MKKLISILALGLISVGAAYADDYTWTMTSSSTTNVKVYGDGLGLVNLTDTGYFTTFSNPNYVVLSVSANYNVTGSTNTDPSWTTPFATLSTSTSTLSKNLYNFYVGAHKQVSNKVFYTANQGAETWTGTETNNGATLTITVTRNRDYFVSGPDIQTDISDAPGGGGGGS